jgi:type II secretory pathway pseudopilin PulG
MNHARAERIAALRSRRSREGGETGLTLVEVVICLGLLGFVAAGMMSLLTIAVHQNKLAQMRSVATGLAAERIQQMTSMPFQSSASCADYALAGETVAASLPVVTFTADFGSIPNFPDYRRVLTLTYDVPVSGMLRVESRVFWQDLNQGLKNHVMITYLHPGLEEAS